MATPSRSSNWAATSRSTAAGSSTVDCSAMTPTTTPAMTSRITAVTAAIRPTFDFCGGAAGGCCHGWPYCGCPYGCGDGDWPYEGEPYGGWPYWGCPGGGGDGG